MRRLDSSKELLKRSFTTLQVVTEQEAANPKAYADEHDQIRYRLFVLALGDAYICMEKALRACSFTNAEIDEMCERNKVNRQVAIENLITKIRQQSLRGQHIQYRIWSSSEEVNAKLQTLYGEHDKTLTEVIGELKTQARVKEELAKGFDPEGDFQADINTLKLAAQIIQTFQRAINAKGTDRLWNFDKFLQNIKGTYGTTISDVNAKLEDIGVDLEERILETLDPEEAVTMAQEKAALRAAISMLEKVASFI